MEAAAAPVSLKGTREPLELVVAGAFLSCVSGVIPALIASLSLALGLRELRRAQAAPLLQRWLSIGETSAWCACVLLSSSYFANGALILAAAAISIAWFAAASVLGLLSQAPVTTSLTSWFSILRWFMLIPALAVLLLLTPLSHSMTVREAPARLVIDVGPSLVLAILALRLRMAASRQLP